MSTETVLFVIIIVLLAGALPLWPHSKSWGYAPTSVLALILIIFFIWALAGERPLFRSSGNSLKSSMENVGDDIKATGRDVGDSIRRTVE